MSRQVKWSTNQVMDLKAEILRDLDLEGARQGPEARLVRIMERVNGGSEPASGEDFLLSQFVHIQVALEHHASHGGLSTGDVKRLTETAELILRSVGIGRSGSRLSFLHSDLHRAKSQILSSQGDLWQAAWQAEMAKHLSYRATDRQESTCALTQADAYLRLGHASLAIATYATAASESGDEGMRAVFGRAVALRYAGDTGKARKLLKNLLERVPKDHALASEVEWELLKLKAQTSLQPELLIPAVSKQFKTYRHTLEAKLWLFAGKSKTAMTRLAKTESIRRRFARNKDDMSVGAELHGVCRIVENAYDNGIPLPDRLEQLGDVLATRNQLVTVEHEALLLAAVVRVLIRYSQESMAQLVLAEYQELSRRLSHGVGLDCTGLLGDVDPFRLIAPAHEEPLKTSKLERAIVVTGVAGKSMGIVASHRLRRIIASQEERQRLKDEELYKIGETLFASMGKLKGGLMKVGQILSFAARVSDQIQIPTSLLQAEAQPSNPEAARAVIREDLGAEPEELFAEWPREPFAVGSIGQVFRARLRDGREVAVKTQHPGIVDAVKADLGTLALFSPVLSMYLPAANTKALMHEFRQRLLEETDYRLEAQHQMEFGEIFRDDPIIRIPAVIGELSGKRVLTMEYARGMSFKEFRAEASQEAKDRAAEALARFVGRAFSQFRLYNGDPHPGNYIFAEDGSIWFIDFGCVQKFSESYVKHSIEAVRSALEGNLEANRRCWEVMGYVADPRKFDFKAQFDMVRQILRPAHKDETVLITKEWVEKVLDLHADKNPNKNCISPPQESVLLIRVAFGLISLLADLEPRINWRRLLFSGLYQNEADYPPEIAI